MWTNLFCHNKNNSGIDSYKQNPPGVTFAVGYLMSELKLKRESNIMKNVSWVF